MLTGSDIDILRSDITVEDVNLNTLKTRQLWELAEMYEARGEPLPTDLQTYMLSEGLDVSHFN